MAEISVEGLLNIEVDKLATQAYHSPGVGRTDPTAAVFAEEAYGVFIDGAKVTSKVKRGIIDRCGEEHLRNYLLHKHCLSEGKLEGVNWRALEGYLNSLSVPHRASQVKLQHGWIPTNSFLYLQRRVACDKCLLCELATETVCHVRRCPALAAARHRRERVERFCRDLRGINTAPEIIQCWRSHIEEECGLLVTVDGDGPIAAASGLQKALGTARRHQSVLSWEGFLQGRVSIKWNDVQACHERQWQETAVGCTSGPVGV
jgi:hypothetical protein